MTRSMTWLTVLLVALVALGGTARAQDLDRWAKQRNDCWEMRKVGEYEKSFQCLYDLWENHKDEMSDSGRIDTLEKLARLYVIHADQPSEAQNCFEYILKNVDRYFVPDDFDRWNVNFRRPLLAAYADLGLDGEWRSPDIMNVALLDFVVADVTSDEEIDLERLEDTLPDFLSAYLSQALSGVRKSGEEVPIRVVGYQERERLLAPVRSQQGSAARLSQAAMQRLGQQQVVQAFVLGSVSRYDTDEMTVALRLFSTETAVDLWGGTRTGEPEEVFAMLQDLLGEMISSVTERESVTKLAGAAELGPMARGVRVLQLFHEAMLAAEEGRYGDAIDKTELALDLSPESEVLREHLDRMQAQQAQLALAERSTVTDALPAPSLQ